MKKSKYELSNEAGKNLTRISSLVFLLFLGFFFVFKLTPSMTGFAVATADSVSNVDDNIDKIRYSEYRIPIKLSILTLFVTLVCLLGMYFERKEHGLV